MIRHSKNKRGAVLVVALIMLAMLTFLTVAFVGFARFERASVTAALKRTDQDFAARQGLAMAVSDVVRGVTNLTNQAPMGLQVSQGQTLMDCCLLFIWTRTAMVHGS